MPEMKDNRRLRFLCSLLFNSEDATMETTGAQ